MIIAEEHQHLITQTTTLFDFLSTHKTSNREAQKTYGHMQGGGGTTVAQGTEEIVEPAETNQPEETTEDARMDKTVELDEIAQLENTVTICAPLEETDQLEDTTSTTPSTRWTTVKS